MAEFRFNNDHNTAQASAVIDVLRQPRLWIPTEKNYPGYDTWLQKVEGQIISGTKRAMVAYFGNKTVGAVVYQRHPEIPDTLEVRNISVSPDVGGRYVGSFMLRNSELEAAAHDFPGIERITVDTKQDNTGMTKFLLDHEYRLEEVRDLYGLDAGLDAVFVKTLQ